MQARTTSSLTPPRIVALALIAVLVGGLAYLRFMPGSDPLSVPKGAKAGDLTLAPCTYGTEEGRYSADCGTLVVPEDRAAPTSRLIALPVIRIRARSVSPAEPIFRLEGGPGLTNMEFRNASRFAANHDVVLVGYRGVDGSSVLDCPEVESAIRRSSDFLSDRSFRAYADAFRSCADRLTREGVDLDGYSLSQRVDDFEAVRVALGYGRINLLSESAGTRTALVYAWRYPESIHRSVMIGVNPPGHFLWDGETTDELLGHYGELCAKDKSCSRRTVDLVESMRRTAPDIPDRWWFLPIESNNIRLATFYGLMESTSAAGPLNGPAIFDSWLAAAAGDPSGFWLMSVFGKLVLPQAFVWGDMASAARIDAAAAREYFAGGGDKGSLLGNPATEFLWGGGRLIDAWPANSSDDEYRRVRTSDVETLLIGGTLDFSTPAKGATEELLPYLPNGRQVVLAELGHTADFWSYQPTASSRLINTFFATGSVDDSLYTPATVDFTPTMSHTVIAKIAAGTLVGLPLLAFLSLAWVGLGLFRRGRYGVRASALLRTLNPVLLGLGGWSLAALIILSAFPSVPLDDELVASLSVGASVGLGVFLAWTNRDRPAGTGVAGLAAALGGALLGAWQGFNAMEGLLGLFTAVGGAVLGANLVLVFLDVARAHQAVRPAAAGQISDAREAPHPAV